MTSPATRVLVLGLDSASPELLDQWMQSGDMPNLARLRKRGAIGATTQPDLLGNGAVWSCFHAGLNPGREPFFDGLRHFDAETYSFRNFKPGEVDVEWTWRRLAKNGKRCLLVDLPYTHLEPVPNGVMILDWGTHNPTTGDRLGVISEPPEVAQEVRELVGEDPVGGIQCDWVPRNSPHQMEAFREQLIERADKRATLFLHYLNQGGWDYAEVAFSEPHCGGHYFWHVNDPFHEEFDAALAERLGEPLKDIYRAIDRSLGRIIDAVDERTFVLLYSSHGMGVQHSASGLLDRVLDRLDTNTCAPAPRRQLKHMAVEQWRRLPYSFRKPFRPLTRQVGKNVNFNIPRYVGNRADRRFFEVPVNNMTGGVRVNLKGREANGLVDPAELDSVLEDISEGLRQIVKAETGEPLVSDIVRGDQIYPGPFARFYPDLFVSYNRETPIGTIRSDRIGELDQRYAGARSGDHVPGGLFMAAGAGVTKTVLNSPVAAVDFAPTLSTILGVEPGDTDGEPITALLQSEEMEPA
ncbi:MAG: alkaline phosphatase family protein [Pseudomonadota bacterium]